MVSVCTMIAMVDGGTGNGDGAMGYNDDDDGSVNNNDDDDDNTSLTTGGEGNNHRGQQSQLR